MAEQQRQSLCPRLIDYLAIVGSRSSTIKYPGNGQNPPPQVSVSSLKIILLSCCFCTLCASPSYVNVLSSSLSPIQHSCGFWPMNDWPGYKRWKKYDRFSFFSNASTSIQLSHHASSSMDKFLGWIEWVDNDFLVWESQWILRGIISTRTKSYKRVLLCEKTANGILTNLFIRFRANLHFSAARISIQ